MPTIIAYFQSLSKLATIAPNIGNKYVKSALYIIVIVAPVMACVNVLTNRAISHFTYNSVITNLIHTIAVDAGIITTACCINEILMPDPKQDFDRYIQYMNSKLMMYIILFAAFSTRQFSYSNLRSDNHGVCILLLIPAIGTILSISIAITTNELCVYVYIYTKALYNP